MGLPVVSFASDGVRESVAHGETGFLAPERDTDVLAHYLQRLCDDESLCARMGEAARIYVCTQFNLRTQTRKLEVLYTLALGKVTDDLLCCGREQAASENLYVVAEK